MLEKVEIAQAMDLVPNTSISLFENLPRLHDVLLKGPSHCWNLPWAQLTRLRYHVSSVREGVQVVHLCPQLAECTLEMLAEAADMDLPPIDLSRHLRFLRVAVNISMVTHSAEAIMKTIFTCLTAPELVALEVVGQFAPEDFISFLTRSDCPLENLFLGPGYVNPNTLIAVFKAVPGLRRLVVDADMGTTRRLQNRAITAKVLERLTIYPAAESLSDSDYLLPQLEHLGLTTGMNFLDQPLLDLIESRWVPWATEVHGVPVMRLTSVDLDFTGTTTGRWLHPTSVEALKLFSEAGLPISLKNNGTQVSLLLS
ncbi:hypothetical protein FB45DRAFT_940660 [Roridomyces roridus]|uniref:Uncharacterized protein n=1 Tax=Roridomyces roridus TaxID=1738132 RepID=A0AAD7B6R1_9AGAR|nr:hypothetical protein FB45DRAFT_940660 [Roridomyces roridus]